MKSLKDILITGVVGTTLLLNGCGAVSEYNPTNNNPIDGDKAEYSEHENPIDGDTDILIDGDKDIIEIENETEYAEENTEVENEIETETPTTYCASGNVKTFDPEIDEKALENVNVKLLCNSTSPPYGLTINDIQTDENGNWEQCGIYKGECEIKYFKTDHLAYIPGILIVEDEQNLETNAKLIPTKYEKFVKEILYYNDYILKWSETPIWDIYTLEHKSGEYIGQEKIDEITSIIQDKIANFANLPKDQSYQINIFKKLPPMDKQPENGHIEIHLDNSNTPSNGSYFSDGIINSASSNFKTSSTKGTIMQELGASIFGSGESNNYISVFNQPHYSDDWTIYDNMLSKIHFSRSPRTKISTGLEEAYSKHIIN